MPWAASVACKGISFINDKAGTPAKVFNTVRLELTDPSSCGVD
jgi:hypothetical protein